VPLQAEGHAEAAAAGSSSQVSWRGGDKPWASMPG
jgi:hypothetical protein